MDRFCYTTTRTQSELLSSRLASSEQSVTWIHSGRYQLDHPLREALNALDLLALLAKRDVRLRYRHTIVGVGWAVVQPLFTMLVLVVFRPVANFANDIPTAVSSLCGRRPDHLDVSLPTL